jgi:hypothetical protein
LEVIKTKVWLIMQGRQQQKQQLTMAFK